MHTTTTARREDRTTGAHSPRRSPRGGRPAFTLTELLIVIGLIVLVITLAVPAFKAMSGGRSVDAAQNQLAAILGAARAEAIGLQKVRGVFFYVDPATERVNAALVEDAPAPEDAPANGPAHYVDLVPDRDPLVLPVGVGLQGIDNSNVTGSPPTRKDDGYIGYNVFDKLPVRYGGVVLFDGYGRLVNRTYGFLLAEKVGKSQQSTRLAELLGYAPPAKPAASYFIPRPSKSAPPPISLFGFVLYDGENFRSVGDPARDRDRDPEPNGDNYDTNEKDEESWLDKNASPILINRYNGTLIRSE